jgi:hypothetical protein
MRSWSLRTAAFSGLLIPLLAALLGLAASSVTWGATDAEAIDLEIVRLPGSAGWEARYHWHTPVTRLKFVNDFGGARASWQVVSQGLRLVTQQEGDFLESSDGSPFRNAVLRLASNTVKPPNDYPLNVWLHARCCCAS